MLLKRNSSAFQAAGDQGGDMNDVQFGENGKARKMHGMGFEND